MCERQGGRGQRLSFPVGLLGKSYLSRDLKETKEWAHIHRGNGTYKGTIRCIGTTTGWQCAGAQGVRGQILGDTDRWAGGGVIEGLVSHYMDCGFYSEWNENSLENAAKRHDVIWYNILKESLSALRIDPAVGPWRNSLTSLSLSFLICEVCDNISEISCDD